ncbi:hypothetical protein [Roseateles flavus]|uniref:Uncharacterized protein n=1 Tax=Roseateles flavus TaxID=3149041 RepID=A0ABV0G9R0_9BURK
MIETVVRLTGPDICRDGGSLGMSFESASGEELALLFPVDMVATENQRFVRLGYKTPLLQSYDRKSVVSPITGLERVEVEQVSPAQTCRICGLTYCSKHDCF